MKQRLTMIPSNHSVGVVCGALYDLRKRPADQIRGSKRIWALVCGVNYLAWARSPIGRITEAFRTGSGAGWDEHDSELLVGMDPFYRRPAYITDLVPS